MADPTITIPGKNGALKTAETVSERMLYTPPEVAQLGLDEIEYLTEAARHAVKVGIPGLDEYVAPLLPGQLMAILAKTSNFKTSFMDGWSHRIATTFQDTDSVVVYASTEQTVQEQAITALARESGESVDQLSRGVVKNQGALQVAVKTVSRIPIFRISPSTKGGAEYDQFHLTNIFQWMDKLRNGEIIGRKVRIAALFVDYLQALPIDPEVKRTALLDQRRLQVREDTYRLRDGAIRFACPVVVAVQAKQELKEAPGINMLTPGLYDAEETATIAQRVDRMISLWMPKTTHVVGQTYNHGNISYTVDENLLFVRVCKQRGGLPAGQIFRCRINLATNQIGVEAGK